MHRGYIKIHRKIEEWEWFDDSLTVWFFIRLMMKANWEDKLWHGIIIKRGQFVSSIEHLRFSHGTGRLAKRLSTKTVRTLLQRLKNTNELASQSTNNYTLFSIVNYKKYQADNDNPKGKPDGKRGASEGQQLKNVKHYKNKGLSAETNEKHDPECPEYKEFQKLAKELAKGKAVVV